MHIETMQRRMVREPRLVLPQDSHRLQQLSKEDEPTGSDTDVRREDQDKINRFSRLNQRETNLSDELKTKQVTTCCSDFASSRMFIPKQKDKEDLEEVSNELELADEDDKIP